jgi:hypothetical protein
LPCATKLSRSSLAPARAPDLALAQLDLNDIEVDDNGAVDKTDLKARIYAPVVAVDNLS